MTIQRQSAIGLVPLILNPTALAVVAIGTMGYGLFRLFADDEPQEEPKGISPDAGPKNNTAPEPRLVAVCEHSQPCSEEPAPLACVPNPLQVENQPDKQELIRQAMSELGKKSAAARARRKASNP